MKRLALAAAVVGMLTIGVVRASSAAPNDLDQYSGNAKVRDWSAVPGTPCFSDGGDRWLVPAGASPSICTTSTTSAPSSTAAPTTSAPPTTLAATTTVAPTTVPSTTVPSTTVPGAPGDAQFVETFDGNTGLDRFNRGVWHRDPYLISDTQWSGDHDLNCGPPSTQRVIHRSAPSESFYVCVDHMMTSMGDTSGYSVVWFSPNQVFEDDVTEVDFDVNLTDLGDRKWWKVGVVSDARYNSLYTGSCCFPAPGLLASDVGSADLPTSLATSDLLMATWSGGASAGYPGGLKIGNSNTGVFVNPTPDDKMTRHHVTLRDNHDGTITFTVAGVSVTRAGSFPACPCRVVFADHNYTPDKDGAIQGTTWHWDSIVVR